MHEIGENRRKVDIDRTKILSGCFLIHLCLGSFYSFGNISTYMTSYMRQHSESPDVTNTEFVAVQSTWGMTQGADV